MLWRGVRCVRSCLIIGALTVIAAPGLAPARDVEDMSVGEGETVTKDYGPIVSSNPSNTPRGRANCNALPYCDNIDLQIRVPASYTDEDLYQVEVTLTWPQPDLTNLNLYLYDTNGTTQLLMAQTANHPERLTVLEPPAGTYALNVANERGPNAGYTVSARFVYRGTLQFEADPGPDSPRAGRTQPEEPPAGGAEDIDLSELPQLDAPAQGAAPRPVETPGPDGVVEMKTLNALGPPRNFLGETGLIPSLIVVAFTIAVLGVSSYILMRRRRAEILEEEYGWR